jgi:hypothetical protein
MPKISKTLMVIAAFILITSIAEFVFSALYSWSGLVPLVAGIGGEIAFFGLWMEKESDEDEIKVHLSNFLGDNRLAKLKSKWGWAILMAGIAIEVFTSVGLAAYDICESKITNDKIAAADTRNVPIVSILGRVRVEVRPPFTNFAANLHLRSLYSNPNMPLSDEEELRKGRTALFQFGEHPSDDFGSEIPVVGWIGSIRCFEGISKTNDGNIRFDIFFDSAKSGAPVWNPKDITYNKLKSVTFWVSNEWPPPAGIVGGQIDLLVNGFWPKTFLIQPQTNLPFPYRVTTTNVLQTSEK